MFHAVRCYLQELQSFKRYTDSLLTRKGKLTDLAVELDDALDGVPEGSPHRERVKKRSAQLSVYITHTCMLVV